MTPRRQIFRAYLYAAGTASVVEIAAMLALRPGVFSPAVGAVALPLAAAESLGAAAFLSFLPLFAARAAARKYGFRGGIFFVLVAGIGAVVIASYNLPTGSLELLAQSPSPEPHVPSPPLSSGSIADLKAPISLARPLARILAAARVRAVSRTSKPS